MKGVRIDKRNQPSKRYVAYYYPNGRQQVYIGGFATIEEAEAAHKLHSEHGVAPPPQRQRAPTCAPVASTRTRNATAAVAQPLAQLVSSLAELSEAGLRQSSVDELQRLQAALVSANKVVTRQLALAGESH